jgi:hypothetical protein
VPPEAIASLRLPALSALEAPLEGFLSGLGDAEGIYSFIDGRFGLDLSSPEGVRDAGLDPELGVHAFWFDGATALVAGVSEVEAFERTLRPRVLGSGYGEPVAWQDGEFSGYVAQQPHPEGLALAWAISRNAAAVVVAAGADTAKAKVLHVLRRDPAGASLYATDAYKAAFEGVEGTSPSVDLYLDLRGVASSSDAVKAGLRLLGPVNAALEPVASEALALGARLQVAPDALRLRGRLQVRAEGTAWLRKWTQPGEVPPDFAALLPRDTVALLRLRVSPEPIAQVPNLLLRAVVPDEAISSIHPLFPLVEPLRAVLPRLRGDVALALFGLVEGQAPGALGTARSLRDVLPIVEGALFVSVDDIDGLWADLAGIGPKVEEAGYRVRSAPPLQGTRGTVLIEHPKSGEFLAVLALGRTVALVSGERGYVAVRDAAEGRATRVLDRVETPFLEGVLNGEPAAAGLYLSFNRLSRDLAERGAPPFFLKLLDSIFEAGLRVRVDETNLWLEAEVLQ